MSGSLLHRLGRVVWRARATTVCLLAGYGIWLGTGLWIGATELYDKDKVVPTRLNFSARSDRWIELEGTATLYTLRKLRHRCALLGESRLRIDAAPAERPGLALRIACDFVKSDSRLVLIEGDDGPQHVIDDLRPLSNDVVVPLSSVRTSLRFVPSSPRLRYSLQELRLEHGIEKLSVAQNWELLHETPALSIERGSGFHDLEERPFGTELAPDAKMWSKQSAYLRITPLVPNANRLTLAYTKAFEDYPDLDVWLNGQPASERQIVRTTNDLGVLVVDVLTALT